MKMQKKLALILMIVMLLFLSSIPVWAEEVNSTTTALTMVTTTEEQQATTAADTGTTTEETAVTTEKTAATTRETKVTAAPTRAQGGNTRTSMIILERSGKIAARVTDTAGNPVEGISVGLQLGTTRMPGEAQYTNADGYAVFPFDMPKDGTYLYCYSEATKIDGVIYESASASVGRLSANATTATRDSKTTETTRRPGTTTIRSTRKNTTQKTTANTKELTTYTAPGTTGIEDALVVLDFCFDSGILDSFGVEQQDFADKARLLLEQESYNTIMGDINGILMLSAAASQYEITDQQIEAALAGDAMLSRIDPSDVTRIVMDLSMKYRDAESGELIPIGNAADGSYVFQLPLPDSMRSAQTVGVSAVTADGISEPAMATVSKDGILRFETSSPVGTIVVLGFNSGLLGTLTAQGALTSLIFLGIGLICIGIAIFLFFRFVRQPKKTKKKEDKPEQEMTDTPIESFEAPVSDQEEPLGGLDIFAESNDVLPPKNPADYDIDL